MVVWGAFVGVITVLVLGLFCFLVVLLIVVGFVVFMVADLVWVLRIACCLDYALLACLGRLRLWCCWVRVDGWFDAVAVGCVVCFELVKLMLFVIWRDCSVECCWLLMLTGRGDGSTVWWCGFLVITGRFAVLFGLD